MFKFCLQELPEKWNNIKKQAIAVKQHVAPLQANEMAALRRSCAAFDAEQHRFRKVSFGSFWPPYFKPEVSSLQVQDRDVSKRGVFAPQAEIGRRTMG